MRTPSVAVVLAMTLGIAPIGGLQRQGEGENAAALEAFEAAVTDYMALRAAAIATVPPLKSSRDLGKIREAVRARHVAVAAARPHARQGDLFSKDAAALFRARIRRVLADNDLNDIQALAIVDDEVSGPVPMVIVNGSFPWDYGAGMLTCIVEALPPLPRGLEYRLLHTSLVLVDVDADLIVDILPEVLHASLYARAGQERRPQPPISIRPRRFPRPTPASAASSTTTRPPRQLPAQAHRR